MQVGSMSMEHVASQVSLYLLMKPLADHDELVSPLKGSQRQYVALEHEKKRCGT